MELELLHLDDTGVRDQMLAEFDLDVSSSSLYQGQFMNSSGHEMWPDTLRMALRDQDPGWLARATSDPSLWLETYTQHRATGPVEATVPRTAPVTLANGEFGRFYIRGICSESLNRGSEEVTVTRLRMPSTPRPESDALVGTRINAEALLNDLRGNQGRDTYNGIPGGPNSGLGVRFN